MSLRVNLTIKQALSAFRNVGETILEGFTV